MQSEKNKPEVKPQDLKFVDIHFHLDGSITVETAKKLAQLQNIHLKAKNEEELKDLFTVQGSVPSLESFLQRFAIPGELLQTKEGLSEAVYLIQEDFKKIGGIYLEIRFAPQLHCKKNLTQKDAIQAAVDGLKRSDLKCNLILCIMRFPGNKKENLETIKLAKEFLVQKDGVVGIDIAGDEKNFPITLYKEEFALAKEYGIPFTIHAGESDGPQSIKDALDMGAKRIGHGIRCVEDEELMDRLAKENICLEVCPLSNFCTTSMPKKDYPLKKLLEKGIKVTINTDDMGIVGTDMIKEFNYLINELNLTKEECKQIILNGIDVAFTTDEDKEELRKIVYSI